MFKKSVSILLAVFVLFGMVSMPVGAESVFEDMPEDWSTEALEAAVENGLLKGSDGKILPRKDLTRAEMATIMNNSFKSSDKASIAGFTDVSTDAWYYDEMAKAVQMEIFQGSNNKLSPEKPISREEAFVVISRAFKVEESSTMPVGYDDASDVSAWAANEVYGLMEAGYVAGSNGKINPKGTITRAEFAQVMFNVVKTYISTPGEYTSVAEGNVMINVPGVTLENLNINGDLILGDGVGSGDVVLDNVNVGGRVVVRGGGQDSLTIKGNSEISKIVVAKVAGRVSIKLEDNASVGNIEVLVPMVNLEVGENAKVGKIVTNQRDTAVAGEGEVGAFEGPVVEEKEEEEPEEEEKEEEKEEEDKKEEDKDKDTGGGYDRPSKTRSDILAERVDRRVSQLDYSKSDAEISFNERYREVTINIKNNHADILDALRETNAIELLLNMDEVTGYGNIDFKGMSDAAIKSQILEDTLAKLGVTDNGYETLGQIIGKTIEIEVKAEIDGRDITDTYTFMFK